MLAGVQWESTDNFGNLVIAQSGARDDAALRADLEDMVAVVFARHEEDITFSIDPQVGQILAPRPSMVTHIMNVPWFVERSDAGADTHGIVNEVKKILDAVIVEFHPRSAVVTGPWPD